MREAVINEPEVPVDRVLVAPDPQPIDPIVPEQHDKPVPEEQQAPPPVVDSPLQGAVQEAKPDYLRNPAPVYPKLARDHGWEGLVLLRVLVRVDGTVEQVDVTRSSGRAILDEEVLRTVRRWRFLPARIGRMALTSWVRVPIRFQLVD